MRRLIPITVRPKDVRDADYVLVTHSHRDHTDPATLVPISNASRHCRFICPNEVAQYLVACGIAAERITPAGRWWIPLGDDLSLIPVPAAHVDVELDESGFMRYVGFVIEYKKRRIYHAGDTSVHDHIIDELRKLKPIDVAFLPVNERNYFRDKQGIVGNMSIREAFLFAEELNVSTVVPMHWNMFAPNCAYREEIEILYTRLQPKFRLMIEPESI